LIKVERKHHSLASFIAKGLLPYRGLGSGIKRALEVWPAIEFEDDRDGCIFKAVIRREAVASTTQKILEMLKESPYISRSKIAEMLGDITEDGVKYHLNKMKKPGVIERIGADKGGYWKVCE